MTNSILIVDDHEEVRKGLRAYIETLQDFEVIGEAVSGEQTLALVSELIPNIILLDLIMPGMDGLETIRRVKQISPRTQIVVLTSYHKDEQIFPALRCGAISYILKDMKMEKLRDALRCAMRGEVTLNPGAAARVLQNVRGEGDGEPMLFAELTDREMSTLKLIADGQTNRQIAEELVVSENTVQGYVLNILSKLHFVAQMQAMIHH